MKRILHLNTNILSALLAVSLAAAIAPVSRAQDQTSTQTTTTTTTTTETADSGTSTDLFVMLGSDFVRPGLLPKANYNIGIGHTFDFLKKDPLGDELTFSYTYEDAGPGFWHSDFGSHTESVGVMKNFDLPKTKLVSGYTCIQVGVSSFTGGARVQNHFSNGDSLGAAIHFTDHHAVWV